MQGNEDACTLDGTTPERRAGGVEKGGQERNEGGGRKGEAGRMAGRYAGQKPMKGSSSRRPSQLGDRAAAFPSCSKLRCTPA
eukprot:5672689-Pleurochrysis_carterae.AAC.3